MRLLSAITRGLAALILLLGAAAHEVPELGVAALVVAALGIFLGKRRPSWNTLSLALFAALAALTAAAGDSVLLPAIALTAALHGWDLALASERLTGIPTSECRPILLRYGLSSAVVAAASILVVLATTAVRLQLSFGVAAALAAGFFLLTMIFGVILRRPRVNPVEAAEAAARLQREDDEPLE
jgi:hypothetical protein